MSSEQIFRLMDFQAKVDADGIYLSSGPAALVWEDEAGQLHASVIERGLEKDLHATLAALCLPVARFDRFEPNGIYGAPVSETTVGVSYRAPGPALVEAGWTLALRYPQHGVAGLLPNGAIAPDDDPATAA